MQINFQSVSDSLFEELCFDLLLDYGFEKLILRSGGADSGRDIQGEKYINDQFVGSYYESWFFECKRYKNAVNQDVLNSKISWADAEQPDHLVFIISSCLSNNTRTWLDKIAKQKTYRIHIVEGKRLESIVKSRPHIMRRYFFSKQLDLVENASRSWIMHNLIPECELISSLVQDKLYVNYGLGELCFLWCSARIRQEKLDEHMHDSYPINFDPIFECLKDNSTTTGASLDFLSASCLLHEEQSFSEHDLIYNKVFACELAYLENGIENIALYSFVSSEAGEGLEIIVLRNSNLTHSIRHIPRAAEKEFLPVCNVLKVRNIFA
ncbi:MULTISPECIES: restriction endonuclease [unclassified Halomonas]|uniref:restriction endonuclease n=1 Tax=unclassified Halomonas TaxID=2609666 RepID=UPI000990603A|nr:MULTISPECIES: restriction endonuclease [unclassified Halomonas]AQU83128.1 hypothetical protein B2G49_11470 [Halomonas sp. 'Soap Lake \